jgi:hypothetical protein
MQYALLLHIIRLMVPEKSNFPFPSGRGLRWGLSEDAISRGFTLPLPPPYKQIPIRFLPLPWREGTKGWGLSLFISRHLHPPVKGGGI